MSKKRPKTEIATADGAGVQESKVQPEYWGKRLFKGVYIYKGKQVAAKNWSVKIQHSGERHTLSLSPRNRDDAAKEACRLYQSIVREGWKSVLKQKLKTSDLSGNADATAVFSVDYWAQKLVHRQHTIPLHLKAENELSARIDYRGVAYYFPLQSSNAKIAAAKALQIFETVVEQGWEKTFALFPRELTLAFRWSDSPLAWTYTTIHTEIKPAAVEVAQPVSKSSEILNVAIAEADAGIRQALVTWLNRTEHLRSTADFSTATEAVEQVKSGRFQLLLCSQNLASQTKTLFADELKKVTPLVACLLYSSYEDSEELFRATPGGAAVYLLKRTSPSSFLQPIEACVRNGSFTPARISSEIWKYFKETFAALPTQNSDRALTGLTRREHEVLALLGKGFPDKEIADRLHISIWTVNGHVKNIFDKLHVHNRTEAALKYLQK